MPSRITHVVPGSIASRLGLKAGDEMHLIAGEPVIDQIDYQALTAQRVFDMDILTLEGEKRTVHVKKQDWEPLGITLDQSIVSAPRPCTNHCIFCFIDQMPPNMRNTLYVKDDDWRLSLMM
ncbi:MAG: radical SAM protein, partial [Clostridia bacterium]|nr:radical SAM protein [Clostridia bacterium]